MAIDPDNDTLTYSFVSGPTEMSIDSSTGVVTWSPNVGEEGQHVVVLRATDPEGLFADQNYVLEVTQNVPNRPPQFTTVPVVDAFSGAQYVYASNATDPDGDALTYAVENGPAGRAIDAVTGYVTWDVTDKSLVGQFVPVTLSATVTGQGGAGHKKPHRNL